MAREQQVERNRAELHRAGANGWHSERERA
jgi:hypothetical protein